MIIDPAVENQVYCVNGTIAKWFINETMIGFNSEQLSNGTSFNKEALPSGTKIIWDNSEHIINNVNNYSYSISNYYYLVVSARGTNYPYSTGILSESGTFTIKAISNTEMCDLTNGLGFQNSTFWGVGSTPCNICQQYNIGSVYGIFTDGSLAKDLNGRYVGSVCNNTSASITTVTKTGIKLIITDNNIDYLYDIVDINSIEVIDLSSNQSKFTFNATNALYLTPESFELIANSDSKVSLVCGLDCPPNTCLKVRCNNIVCCYNNEGKVIDSFYDFNKEVETCY
jgi:hypothetical protein